MDSLCHLEALQWESLRELPLWQEHQEDLDNEGPSSHAMRIFPSLNSGRPPATYSSPAAFIPPPEDFVFLLGSNNSTLSGDLYQNPTAIGKNPVPHNP